MKRPTLDWQRIRMCSSYTKAIGCLSDVARCGSSLWRFVRAGAQVNYRIHRAAEEGESG